MWNNSYRTPTERWQKTSDFPKDKKIPTYLGRAKEKWKTETKEQRWDPHLWEGAVKEERFPHTRKPLHWWRWGVGVSFGATEESTATGVQRAKRRDSRTEDQCRPALTSMRRLSAHTPGRVAAGSWDLGFGGQTPGRGLGLAAWRQPEGS